MGWKNWPYWLRGGIISFIIVFALTILYTLNLVIIELIVPGGDIDYISGIEDILTVISFFMIVIIAFIVSIPLLPLSIFGVRSIPGIDAGNILSNYLFFFFMSIIWFIIGAIIGLIVGKVKKKKQENQMLTQPSS